MQRIFDRATQSLIERPFLQVRIHQSRDLKNNHPSVDSVSSAHVAGCATWVHAGLIHLEKEQLRVYVVPELIPLSQEIY